MIKKKCSNYNCDKYFIIIDGTIDTVECPDCINNKIKKIKFLNNISRSNSYWNGGKLSGNINPNKRKRYFVGTRNG